MSFLSCYRFGNRTEGSGLQARAVVKGCGRGWAAPGLRELMEAGTDLWDQRGSRQTGSKQKSSCSDCRWYIGGGLLDR